MTKKFFLLLTFIEVRAAGDFEMCLEWNILFLFKCLPFCVRSLEKILIHLSWKRRKKRKRAGRRALTKSWMRMRRRSGSAVAERERERKKNL